MTQKQLRPVLAVDTEADDFARRRLALMRVMIWAASESTELGCHDVSLHLDRAISSMASAIPKPPRSF